MEVRISLLWLFSSSALCPCSAMWLLVLRFITSLATGQLQQLPCAQSQYLLWPSAFNIVEGDTFFKDLLRHPLGREGVYALLGMSS